MAFLLGLITSAPVGFAPTAWAATFDASFIAGVRALQKQDFAAAVRHLQAALQEDPDSLEARKFLAIAAFRGKDYPVAIDAAGTYLEGREDSDVRMILARSLAATGQDEKAIAQFQAVANKPDDPFRDAANQAIAELRAKQPAPSAAGGGFKRPDGLSGSVQLALEYDSNVATAVDESTRGASAVDDARLVPTVNLSYDKPVGDRYYLGAGMLGFANFYEDEAQRFELQFLRADIHAGIVGQSWDLKRGYEYDVSVFDYDKALVSHRLSALYINLFSPRFVFVGLGSVARDLFAQNPL